MSQAIRYIAISVKMMMMMMMMMMTTMMMVLMTRIKCKKSVMPSYVKESEEAPQMKSV